MNDVLLIGFAVICILMIIISIYAFFRGNNKTNQENDRPEMSEKNNWLHPTDGLGKMEKGRNGTNK